MEPHRSADPAPHKAVVSAVALAGDGTVLSASYDGTLALSRFAARRLVPHGRFTLHTKGINCVALSRGDGLAVTGGSDSTACLVDLRTGDVRRLEHPGDVECAVFSPDGRRVLTGGTNGEARIWDTESGELTAVVPHGRTVGAACTCGDRFVTGCNDAELRIFDQKGRELYHFRAADGPIKAVVETRAGVVCSSHDCTIRLAELGQAATRVIARRSTTPKTLAAAADGVSVWVGCYDQTVSRVFLDTAEQVATQSVRLERAWAHGLAAQGPWLALGSFEGRPILLDVSGPTPRLLDEGRTPVPCISTVVPTDPGRVVVGGDSGLLRERTLSESSAERVLAALPAAITGVCSSADGLIAGTWGGEVVRLAAGRRLWTARWPDPRAETPVLRVDADGERVLAGLYTGGAACFDAHDGRLLWRQDEASGAVKYVGLHGPWFAMTGRYDPLRVGRAADGVILARLDLRTPVSDVVAFCPSSNGDCPRLAVTAEDNEIWLVDLLSGESGLRLEVVHRSGGHDLPVKAVAWVDRETIIAGDYSGRLVRHRVCRSPQPLAALDCRLGVSGLAVAGSVLVWATFDGSAGAIPLE